MHVISRTEWTCSGHVEPLLRTACLTHTDVLVLLVLALMLASWCCFRILAGTATSAVFFFFVSQAIFGMLVCPTFSIAVRVTPSAFLTGYVRDSGASWLLRAIALAMLTQTLFVFWHLF
jgi:hypothetical protein